MIKNRFGFFSFLVSACIGLCLIFPANFSLAAGAVGTAAPLPPEGFKIQPPSPNIPKEIREISGKWAGEIQNAMQRVGHIKTEYMNVLFVVEEILGDKEARVYFSWGDVQGPAAKAKGGKKGSFIVPISKEEGEVKMSFEVPEKEWSFDIKHKNGNMFCKMRGPTFTRWGDLAKVP